MLGSGVVTVRGGRKGAWAGAAVLLAGTLGGVHPVRAAAPDTAPLAAVLTASVKENRVDYAAVRAQRKNLEAYVAAVAAADPKALGADAKAFHINAYNALVLLAVLREQDARGGKLASVLDVKGFFDVQTHVVAGQTLTLNALEEQKLRRAFEDPRIHFAVNCASQSCPPLRATPYTTAGLDAALDDATRAYLAGTEGIRPTATGVSVTKLLEWYAADFGGLKGVTAFLLKHAPAAHHAGIQKGITFHEYGWALNAR